MFNAKLITAKMMKRLRISVLVSIHPFCGDIPIFALFSALAVRAPVTTLLAQGVVPRAATSRSSLILVILAAGMLPLLLFQGVCPVSHSISLRIALESCALNAGLPNGFPSGLVLAGGGPPLPLLPLPCSGHLGSVVARSLRPLTGTLQCTDVDLMIGQSFGADNK